MTTAPATIITIADQYPDDTPATGPQDVRCDDHDSDNGDVDGEDAQRFQFKAARRPIAACDSSTARPTAKCTQRHRQVGR